MPILQDKYRAALDAKGEANKLFRQAGVPTTFLNTTFFFQGFLQGSGRREVVPATDEGAEHLRRQDADDVLVHSAAAGASLITGRTSIHS